jgi:transcriptional regulator with XRE-family HTH domain
MIRGDSPGGMDGMQRLLSFEEIDHRRAALNVSQSQLCQIARVNSQTYTRNKQGQTRPNTRTLERLASALHSIEKGEAA